MEIETVTIPDFSSEIFTTQEIVLTVVLAQKEALKSEEEKTKINFSTKILSNEDDDSPDSDSEVQVKKKHDIKIEEGYFEYSNFEFENGNFEKQSGELKWGN